MTANGIELDFRVLRHDFTLDVDLVLPASGITGIYGPSGSGKTTLLRVVAGLERAPQGRVVVAGDTWQDDRVWRTAETRETGYVFQEPRLFRHLDVAGNLEFARRRRVGDLPIEESALLALLGVDSLVERRVRELSGGEAQRVAIARALLRGPRLLLMDEPLASIDRQRRDELMPFLDRLHAELSLPILYVSHSFDEICRLADHLVLLDGGRATASDSVQRVLADPTLPLFDSPDASAVLDATVTNFDTSDELTELEFSGGRLLVAGRHGAPGMPLRVRVRAADVSVSLEPPKSSSILNVVPATIDAMQSGADGMTTLRLVVGNDRLLARISRRSLRELKLVAGRSVYAQLKAASIRDLPN